MKRFLVTALLFASFLAGRAAAQPVIDGTADGAYGTALSVQNTRTQFGDNNLGDLIATGNGGSEINQVFGVISGDRLYVTITGNLENNFNKLEVFIDSVAGGVNTITGSALPAGVDAFCCGGFGTTSGALQRMDGLTFDTGFDADYYLTFSHGREGVGLDTGGGNRELNFWGLTAHYAELNEGTAGDVVRAGLQVGPQGLPNVLRASGMSGTFADPAFVPTASSFPTNPTTSLIGPALPGLSQGELIDQTYALGAGGCDGILNNAGCLTNELEFVLPVDTVNDPTNPRNHRDMENTIDLRMALNNVNIEGVTGTGGPDFSLVEGDDPENVTTGIEFSIPLQALGNPNGPIKLTAFVNGTGHDFSSNQYSGEGVLTSNFGSLMPNLALEAPGDQFVTVPVAAGVPGDYNENGVVDAADYTVWRDSLGGTSLPNEGASLGTVDQADYDFWKTNFGNDANGSGSLAASGVPEPCALMIAVISAAAVFGLRPRREMP